MPVDSTRTEYAAQLHIWQRCRDVAGGADAVKSAAEKYLPRLSGQTQTQYEAYRSKALFYNATGRTIQGMTGIAMQQPPTVAVPQAVKTAITQQLTDVTLAGQPFEGFAGEVVRQILNPGRYGVLVDYHEDPDPATARPYWVPYRAEQIRNWNETQRGGDRVLTLVVLEEQVETRDVDDFGVTCIAQYRVLDLEDVAGVGRYRVRLFRRGGVDNKEWVLYETLTPTRRGERLTFIPFVIFGPQGVTSDVVKPPLLDLVDVNISHFQTSADYEHGCHFTGLPTPIITGSKVQGELRIGSEAAIVLPEPEAKAYYLEFNGDGLKVLERNLTRKEELMARLGGRLLEGRSSTQEAAETIKTRYAGDSATLQTIVGSASLGLSMLLRWHVWWHGVDAADQDVSASITSDFFAMDLTADEVKAAVLDYQAGGMSFETFYWKMQQGGWARPGVDAKAEKALIDAEASAAADAAAAALPADTKNPNPNDPPQPGA